MAFGKKFDKNKNKDKRKQQNPLFKRKKFCRFTVANVEQIEYKAPCCLTLPCIPPDFCRII